MSEHERQELLAGVHVGVISIERVDGPSLIVPIWHGDEPGGLVRIITGAESLKGKLLNAAGRFDHPADTGQFRPIMPPAAEPGPGDPLP